MVLRSLERIHTKRAASCFWVTLTLSALLGFSRVGNCQQDPEPPTKVGGNKDLPNILNDGTIDTSARLYLDDNGKPILVPAESYETFLKSKSEQSAQRNSQNQLPSFVIEQTEVALAVKGSYANVVGTFKISLSSSAPAAVSIPLRFDSCQLIEAPQFEGGGENLIEVRGGAAGYQWYLKSEPGSKHSVILKGGTVVARQGERNELRVNLPVSPCNVVITLPANAIDEKVSGEGNEFIDREANKEAIVLRIRASGGDLSISWRDADSENRLSAVEAESTTSIEVLEQTWRARSDLNLRWYGRDATDTIIVNLPAGARWIQLPIASSDSYSITDISNSDVSNGDVSANEAKPPAAPTVQRVKIRNQDPSLMQPINLRLEWEWIPPADSDEKPGKPIRVPAITIDGVDGHTGTVEFSMPTGFMPTWHEEAGTRLVPRPRSVEIFDRSQYLFRFSRQPLQLTVRFRRPTNVASIRPTYLAHIDSNKLKLTAWLDCTFDATQQMVVSLLPSDWIIDSVEAVDMVAPLANGEPLDLQPQSDGSYLITNFNAEQDEIATQRRTRQTWRIIAYRPFERKEPNNLSFGLPQLKSGNSDGPDSQYDHGTGILIVTSSENLLLKNQATTSQGLLMDSLVPQWQPLLGDGDAKQPLVYRFQSRGDAPIWSGTVDALPQQIVLEQNADLFVGDRLVRINQTYNLQITNEPLNPLRFAIRQDASDISDPQLTIDGTPVPLQRINSLETTTEGVPSASAPGQTTASVGWRIYESINSSPLRGSVKLNVLTTIPWIPQGNSQLTEISIPLVQMLVPRETRVREQNWSIRSERDIEIFESLPDSVTSGSEQPETNVKASRDDSLRKDVPQLSSPLSEPRELNNGQSEIVVSARKLESFASIPVRIGRSWLQTTVNGSERRDRYCAQVESTLSRLSIRVPASRNLNHVFINGQRVKFTGEGTQFQIELLGGELRQFQLEVWMTSSESLAWITPLDINIPEIEGAQFYDRFYWQLVVPAIQHMGLASSDLTPEWVWKWNGFWWSRQSGMRQPELERWVGATQQTDLPLSVNSYLLSSFGSGRSFQVWVLSRFMMWLPIGLVAILVSILLISFRALRHPALLLLTAGGLATAAMLAPDLAVLLGQTALMSLGLVSLVLITQAAIESRVRRRSVFTVRPSQFRERSDHFSLARNVNMASPSSTRAPNSVVADGGE